MTGQTQHLAVKISNLPDKCPMTGANLQAWLYLLLKFHINWCRHGLASVSSFFLRSYLLIVQHNHKFLAFISIRVLFLCFSTTSTKVSSVFV